jgi:uncharacterized protein DUF4136
MKLSHLFIWCGLAMAPSALFAQKIKVGYDHAADFSKFHTYTWTKGFPATQERINSEIVASTERQLAARGLKRAEKDADVLVSYSAGVDQAFSYGPSLIARGPNWGGFWADWFPTSGSGVLTGQILVELVVPGSNQCVWRALAIDNISDKVRNDPDALMKKISKMVEKLFTKFPERK